MNSITNNIARGLRGRIAGWLILAVIFLGLFAPAARASHMAGAEVTYECINNCTIRVHLRGYRDCSGSAGFGNNIAFVAQTPGCPQPTALGFWSLVDTTELQPLCASITTQCTTPSGTINGIQEYYTFRDYDICGAPNCIFDIQWSICCRSPGISSLVTPGIQSISLSSVTINTNFTTCNSAPLFDHSAQPYICAGTSYSVDQSATDADGDSLSYELAACEQSATSPVNYNVGFSATQPLGPSWDVQIDPVSGLLSFTPLPGNLITGVICIAVHEWRNGQQIGTVTRDIQVQAITCPSYCGNNLVQGTVYTDANSNCIFDPGETTFQNVQISINSGVGIVTTDNQGKYTAWVNAGTYTFEINPMPNSLFQTTCPISGTHTVTFTAQNDTSLNNDFGRTALIACPQLSVEIGSGLIRPCSTTTYNVSYYNQGSTTALNAYVEVELEPFQTYQSVSGATWVSSTGNVHTFDLGNIADGQYGTFSFQALTDCNTSLAGMTACATAHIFPDSSCFPPNPAWDHSSLSVSGECVGDSSTCYTVTNEGLGMQGVTEWRLYKNSQLLHTGSLQLCGGCDTVLCFSADGNAYRFEIDQHPDHPGSSHPNAVVELCGQPNAVTGQVTAMPLDDDDLFVDISCREVVNSCDPNTKYASPGGAMVPFYYVDSTAALTYTIDFQNIGSADAIRVILEDSLDPRLDVLSIQPGPSSHPYTFEVLSGRRLRFVFDNISLPPFSQDSIGSLGWVQYRVNQVPGNTFGDEIHNNCNIFFDMNLPIRTNTVLNTIGWPTTVSVGDGISATVTIWPNPAGNEAYVRVTGWGLEENLRIELFSLMGQKVYSGEFGNDQTYRIDLEGLASGVYIYRMHSEGRMLKAGKLVVR